jgi:hypothetical protein
MKLTKIITIVPLLTLISCTDSVTINDGFKIEYMEMYSSVSLSNENQGFVSNVTEAYWNTDSLVVSGDEGCFLIEFGKTKYNDEMVKINCGNLNSKLKKGNIKKYIRKAD